ncbi:MAG: hypothetical protein UT20_C0023G0001, partial [Candidatus Levybacteria bacterium GW2011_GWA1_39_11]
SCSKCARSSFDIDYLLYIIDYMATEKSHEFRKKAAQKNNK